MFAPQCTAWIWILPLQCRSVCVRAHTHTHTHTQVRKKEKKKTFHCFHLDSQFNTVCRYWTCSVKLHTYQTQRSGVIMDQAGVHWAEFIDFCRDKTSEPAVIWCPVQLCLVTGTNRAMKDGREHRDQFREDRIKGHTWPTDTRTGCTQRPSLTSGWTVMKADHSCSSSGVPEWQPAH